MPRVERVHPSEQTPENGAVVVEHWIVPILEERRLRERNLITGDTETPRWETINRLFGSALKSHVLAAPHHGSKNATHPASLLNIDPHTVLISAGVDSQYGHPHSQALRVYGQVARRIFSTSMEDGVSLLTQPGPTELTTTPIRSTNVEPNAAA